jgi:8-oxo-dGTP pyrophosphatase MutT (NUDIX family)/catechol 2,3-dioxygenase-like lactoylglutathione lyase family enzyme
MKSKRTWFTEKEIRAEHKDLSIRQTYLWLISSDNKVVIVGDGGKWQLPGGKPAEDESISDTLKRECWEEAGLKLDEYAAKPALFGYYLIENDVNPKWKSGDPYLQIRYVLKVNKKSSEIELTVNEREDDLDTLEEAKFVDLYSLTDHIAWCDDDLEEYVVIKKLNPSSNPPLKNIKFDMIGLFAKDMKKMVEFYRDVLGLKTKWKEEDVYAEFEHEGIRFSMYSRNKLDELIGEETSPLRGINPTFEFAINVGEPENVDKTYRKLIDLGIQSIYEPRNEPWKMRSAMVKDPDGNLIEIKD